MGQKLASWTRAQDLHVTQENPPQILYNQVCTKNQGLCVPSNPLLSAWQVNNNLSLRKLPSPCITSPITPSP